MSVDFDGEIANIDGALEMLASLISSSAIEYHQEKPPTITVAACALV